MRGGETADSSDFDSEYVFENMTQGKETYFENYEIAAERHFAYSVDNGRHINYYVGINRLIESALCLYKLEPSEKLKEIILKYWC